MKETNDINTIQDLEIFRQQIIKKTTYASCISFLIALPIITLALLVEYRSIILVFFALIISTLVGKATTNQQYNLYKKLYRQMFILKTFEKFFNNIVYLPDEGLNYQLFENLNIMKKADRYKSNDHIIATYKDINFEAADVHLEERKVRKEHTDYTNIFKGQWYIFDFKKQFKFEFQIIENNFNGSKRGGLFDKKYIEVETEDIDFNNQFSIFTTNEQECFYLLTPITIERIKNINQVVPGKLIIVFKDNKVHIGVHNENDYHKINLYSKLDEKQIEMNTIEEISDIIILIESLALNNDLFRKEV